MQQAQKITIVTKRNPGTQETTYAGSDFIEEKLLYPSQSYTRKRFPFVAKWLRNQSNGGEGGRFLKNGKRPEQIKKGGNFFQICYQEKSGAMDIGGLGSL